MSLGRKIIRSFIRLRLRPIRVYCLHHVTQAFDADSMQLCDWMSMSDFKQKIADARNSGVEFVSLGEAYRRIAHDYIRLNHYAVLTFDDGYESLFEVLPWLFEEKIPCTLFLNPGYMDGQRYRERSSEKYLSQQDLDDLVEKSQGLLTIGLHGWEHWDATQQTVDEFKRSVSASIQRISQMSAYMPFWAYAWGRHNEATDIILKRNGLVPVLIDGGKNYNDATYLHRELLQK